MLDESKARTNLRKERRSKEAASIESLEAQATQPENYKDAKYFNQLALSQKTQDGLKKANFRELTEIQRKAIPLALSKRDVLGAAKTGSGKTLAFLVPVLEILYRANWNPKDALGALIISPTRELAVQIFEVLKRIGRGHNFSAGLIIGGKDFKVEQDRISHMNILVATPGRLLQHMDQSAGFTCDNLQLLVLDEADRILDMGFQKTVNAIIDNLPPQRQTLLFSATQTRSVKDLARLSLKDSEYVAVHEQSEHSTPKKLSQHYITCELPAKLDILYSFVRTHLQSKTIVFLSSCKQTRFVYECFCKLQPGVPIMHLHGKQKQTKRVDIFRSFADSLHAVLLCTDIAARGLDFPAVDWVVQLDCPEDAETYIHRVGRTARFDAEGHALLMLLPSEGVMVEELQKKKVPVEHINIRANKQQSIQNQLQKICFQDPEIKYLGQKAFVAYMRSVYLQRNKNVFKVNELPAEDFAKSLGLAGAPKIKFVKKVETKKMGRLDETPESNKDEDENEEKEEEEEENENLANNGQPRVKTKYDRMMQRTNQGILSEHYNKLVDHTDDGAQEENDDEFMTLQRVDHALESDSEEDMKTAQADNLSKRQQKMSKKERSRHQAKGDKLVFDEEGNPHQLYEMVDEKEFLKDGDAKSQIHAFINEAGQVMQTADIDDKAIARQKRTTKKLKKKQRDQEAKKQGYDLMSEDEMSSGEEAESEEDAMSEDEAPPRKRKWFEKENDDQDAPSKKNVIETSQPTTLQDQEALALKLLGL